VTPVVPLVDWTYTPTQFAAALSTVLQKLDEDIATAYHAE
jgi:hypothetical protein